LITLGLPLPRSQDESRAGAAAKTVAVAAHREPGAGSSRTGDLARENESRLAAGLPGTKACTIFARMPRASSFMSRIFEVPDLLSESMQMNPSPETSEPASVATITTISAGERRADVTEFLRGRSAPCPRCAYDLRDVTTATCPECGELLELRIGSAHPRFGWLIFAVAPGCFSGVAAIFVFIPIFVTIWQRLPPGQGAPWPVMVADAFGFLSGASVVAMYRHRRRFMRLPTRRQAMLATAVWGVHVLMFFLTLASLLFYA